MDDFLAALQRRLREEMNNLADTVATGGAKDYAEYQKLVGIIEGLARAERELLDLAEKRLKADD